MKSYTDKSTPFWQVIGGACLLAAILDIADAFIFYGLHGVPRILVLQNIASGLLGHAVFVNGVASLIFCVGIPVALIARRYLPQPIP